MHLEAELAPSTLNVPLLAPLRTAPTIEPPRTVDPGRTEIPIEQITFGVARGATHLRRIAHLREEIALAPHVRAAPAFAHLEKKETRLGS